MAASPVIVVGVKAANVGKTAAAAVLHARNQSTNRDDQVSDSLPASKTKKRGAEYQATRVAKASPVADDDVPGPTPVPFEFVDEALSTTGPLVALPVPSAPIDSQVPSSRAPGTPVATMAGPTVLTVAAADGDANEGPCGLAACEGHGPSSTPWDSLAPGMHLRVTFGQRLSLAVKLPGTATGKDVKKAIAADQSLDAEELLVFTNGGLVVKDVVPLSSQSIACGATLRCSIVGENGLPGGAPKPTDKKVTEKGALTNFFQKFPGPAPTAPAAASTGAGPSGVGGSGQTPPPSSSTGPEKRAPPTHGPPSEPPAKKPKTTSEAANPPAAGDSGIAMVVEPAAAIAGPARVPYEMNVCLCASVSSSSIDCACDWYGPQDHVSV